MLEQGLNLLVNKIINEKKLPIENKVVEIKKLIGEPTIIAKIAKFLGWPINPLFTVIESKLQQIIKDNNKDKNLHSTVVLIDALGKEDIFSKHQLKILANTEQNNQTLLGVDIKTVGSDQAKYSIDFLIAWGADVKALDSQGRSYLHTIASNIERPEKLASIATKIIAKAPELLDHPENTWDKEVIKYETSTIKRGELRTPTHIAAYQGNTPILEVYLKNGANVRSFDKKGYAPLHCILATGKMKLDTFKTYLYSNNPVDILTANGENIIKVLESSVEQGKYKLEAKFYSTVEQILGLSYAKGLPLEVKELDDFLNVINNKNPKNIITREKFLEEIQSVLEDQLGHSDDPTSIQDKINILKQSDAKESEEESEVISSQLDFSTVSFSKDNTDDEVQVTPELIASIASPMEVAVTEVAGGDSNLDIS